MARIVVADDDGAVRAAIRKSLEAAGHSVDEAADGQTVLDLYRRDPRDLLLVDIYMPGVDGLETILRLRAEQPEARIVALSGGGFRDKHDVLTMALQAGAQAALAKPFEQRELLAAVSRGLGLTPGEPAMGGRQGPRPHAGASVLLVDDEPQARFVLRKRLELAGYAVTEAADAESALRQFRVARPAVVVADIVLPGKSGEDLIAALPARGVGIIAISGAADRLAGLERQSAGRVGFAALKKPFTTRQLLDAVDAVMPAPAGRSLVSRLWERLMHLTRV